MYKSLKTNLSTTFIIIAFVFLFGITQTTFAAEPYENEANKMIVDVKALRSDLINLIKDADELNFYIGDAEDALDDAEDLLEEAEEQDADEDWDEALEFAKQAFDILDDAVDELDNELKRDAKAEIALAEKYVDAADEALDDTDRNDPHYLRADGYLEEAEDRLDEAEDAYADKKYGNAEDFAEVAIEVAKRVFHELDLELEDYLEKEDEEIEDEKEKDEDEDDSGKSGLTKAQLEEKVEQMALIIQLLMQLLGMQNQ